MSFNLEEAISELVMPDMLKNGFIFYIEENNLKINSKRELNKKFEEFKKMKVGE